MLNKNILITDIRAGMILGKDALSPTGEIVVPKNTVLSQRFLARMINAGVKAINVNIPEYIATEEELSEFASPQTKLKQSAEYKDFRRELLAAAGILSEIFEQMLISPNSELDFGELLSAINSLGSKYGSTLHILDLLQAARDFEDTIYIHSIGVALVSRIIGIKAQFNEQQMQELILASLFHDIGKITISEEVLNKNDTLTAEEYEEVQSHTSLGYELLKKAGLPDYVSLCARHHHERFDGSGYPDQLTGQHIPLLARYVAVADVYSAMTFKRCYREELCPFDVIAAFEKDGISKYDAGALFPFLQCLAQSQIGSFVKLSDGSEGKVIMLNERMTRPIIKIGSEFVDLMRRPELEIMKII